MIKDYDEDKLVQARFKVAGVIEFENNLHEDIEITENDVISMILTNNYHRDFTPIFFVQMMMDKTTLRQLAKYRGYYKFKMGIQSYYINTEDPDDLGEGNVLFSNVFRAEMSNPPPIDDKFVDEDGVDEWEEQEGKQYTSMWFALSDSSVTESNKSREDNSAPYGKCTVADVCGMMLSSGGVNLPIQFDQPDNATEYEQITITTKNLRNSIIETLQKGAYGIYSKGIILYAAFNRFYLMSRYGKNGKTPDEPSMVHINVNSNDTNTPISMELTNEKEPILLASTNKYAFERMSMIDDLQATTTRHFSSETFNKRTVFNNDAEKWESELIYDEEKTDRLFTAKNQLDRKEYIFSDDGNPFAVKSNHEEAAHRTLVTMRFVDIDPIFFHPNLDFNFHFYNTNEAELYDGEYKIFKSQLHFTKSEDKNGLRCATLCFFK
jgi:hypothetical protein